MKKTISRISLIIAVIMILIPLCATLSACTGSNEVDHSQSSTQGGSDATEGSSANDSESASGGATDSESASGGATDSESASGGESSKETDSEKESEPSDTEAALDCEYSDSILYANKIANAVQVGYSSLKKDSFTINNLTGSLSYALSQNASKQVTALKNTAGGTYIENTMDVFVKMADGKTYYAADSTENARMNIYRFGYYYYDVHALGQNFYSIDGGTAAKAVDLDAFNKPNGSMSRKLQNGELILITNGGDPFIRTGELSVSTEAYNAISFTIKTTLATKAQVFVHTTSSNSDNENNSLKFNLINDGEYHTYMLFLSDLPDYSGEVTSLRFDLEGEGIQYSARHYISKVEFLKVADDAPEILLDRIFHTYPDKMYQELHFVAAKDTSGIAELGMVTRVKADSVAAVIVKDGEATHSTIDGVDWESAQYVGFDIKNVGIFGYILPSLAESGRIKVSLVGEYYEITQYATPEGGRLLAPVKNTGNDYNMGHRIYTDESHSFDRFVIEAEFEREPSIYFKNSESYLGYNKLNGAFEYSIEGTSFNPPFFYEQNKHYSAEIVLKGDGFRRAIYIRTKTGAGALENAVLMNDKALVLPIPVEVSKNFGGDDKEPLLYCGDVPYGETLFPLYVGENEKIMLTVLNIYQNWGRFPLKQLSSIQYGSPYYHLSTGVTETSCIVPFNGYPSLNDFRSMSAPFWYEMDIGDNQPQHTHAGTQRFLRYTDSDGNYYATESINNVIDSSGPVYADVAMSFVSYDGRIKVTYTHTEMPQTDENRAYYTIRYQILEDVSFKNFKEDFSFYSAEAYTGYFRRVGYLDENGQSATIKAVRGGESKTVILGKECPYFALYDLYATAGGWGSNNANLGCVVYGSDIVVGGEKYTGNFLLYCHDDIYSLSLDLEEVTLKAGDEISLDLILVPWGSHLSVDDSNMRAIRENSCLDPLTVEVLNGEKMDSTYIPKVRSADGKCVEFTLSGGANNVAVRAYGFKMLTAPKIEELIDGEWTDYSVSSVNTPDKQGNRHYYDGYYTYYDNDGTFSYAFCVDMNGAESRTFRVSAEEKFGGWPAIEDDSESGPLNIYVSASDMGTVTSGGAYGIGRVELASDDSYVRFFGGTDKNEAYFTVLRNDDETVTGQYLVIKYRMPESNTESNNFQVYISTVNSGANESDRVDFPAHTLIKDGEWHIVIMDLSVDGGTYKPNDSGEYIAKYARFDVFNVPMSENSYVDIAYFGISDGLEAICQLNMDEPDGFIVFKGNIKETINFNTGEKTPYSVPSEYIKPGCGFEQSNTPYVSSIDYLNGNGKASGGALNRGGNSNKGIDVIEYNGPTFEEAYLAFAGWTMVYEGIEKYVWSADGGFTWNDASLYGKTDFSKVNSGIIKAANGFFNISGYDSGAYAEKSVYSGTLGVPTGIAAQLTEYVGQTVDVIFAVVPANDTDSLCLIACIEKVRVYANAEDAVKGEAEHQEGMKVESPYIDPTSGYSGSMLSYVSQLDFINGSGPDGSAYKSIVSRSNGGVGSVDLGGAPLGSDKLVISGWTLVQGGWSKMVWSVDGGKTWHDATLYNKTSITTATTAICNAAKSVVQTDFEKYAASSTYQSPMTDNVATAAGLCASLSEYSGENVNIVFAVVPEWAQQTLCIILEVRNVTVGES